MTRLTLLLAVIVSSAASALHAQQPGTRRPNVVVIAIDDLNDWVGCLDGHKLAQTPNIDALAARGTLFASAHCQSPLCNPSRTSLFTGLRPGTTGIYGLAPTHWNTEQWRDVRTLPQSLRAAGYRTAAVGKIYHGMPQDESLRRREFDTIAPPMGRGPLPDEKLVPDTPPHNHQLMDWGTFPHSDDAKPDSKATDWAVDYVERAGKTNRPFALFVGYALPHVPCYVTPQWYNRFPGDDSVLPPVLLNDRADTPRFSWYLHWTLPEPRLAWLRKHDQWRNLCRSYLASTTFVDAQVGRLMNQLKASGLDDNTLVVLWSDHGYHLGEKEISGKNTLWERSTRVPLVFAGPGVTAGGRCDSPVELLDVYPTLVEVLKLPPVEHLEGHSLSPQLVDAAAPREFPAVTTHNQGNHSVRTATHRYIRYADGTEELYDMVADPNEWNNLIDDLKLAEHVVRLRQYIPKNDRPMAAGSQHRTLVYDRSRDVAIWEDIEVRRNDPIPEQ